MHGVSDEAAPRLNLQDDHPDVGSTSPAYRRFVLGVLAMTYTLNFIDRQMLSIVAEDVKHALGLADSDIGFLYGAAFGIFYAVFGIPLGRLADRCSRVKLLGLGLVLWSCATVASAFSRTGTMLSLTRIGVGIGEATAGPCSYSLISDYFPVARRATALAIYSTGVSFGVGLSLFIGGSIIKHWDSLYPGGGPLDLVGWQIAFLVAGAPGLLLAPVVLMIREPRRRLVGQAGNASRPPLARWFLRELCAIVPPFTFLGASRRGPKALAANVLLAVLCGLSGCVLWRLTGDVGQWVAMSVGVYAVASWVTMLRNEDPATFTLIWGTPAFMFTAVGFGLLQAVMYATAFWASTYARRVMDADPAQVGLIIGALIAGGGFCGLVGGGKLADHLRLGNPAGRVLVIIVSLLCSVPLIGISYLTTTLWLFYALQLPIAVFASLGIGAAGATINELVLPRMRGTATSTYLLSTTMFGLALGPYTAGRISVATGSLGLGVLSVLAIAPVALALLWGAYLMLPNAQATVSLRAMQAGEPYA